MNNACVKGLLDFILPEFMVKCDNFNDPGMLPISKESKEEEKVVKKKEKTISFLKNLNWSTRENVPHIQKHASHSQTLFKYTSKFTSNMKMDAKGKCFICRQHNGNPPGLQGGVLSFTRETDNGAGSNVWKKVGAERLPILYIHLCSLYVVFMFYNNVSLIIKEKLIYTATLNILETKRLKY